MIFYSQRTFSKAIPYSNLYHMTQLHGALWLLTRNISTRTPRIATFVILGVPKRTMNEIPNAHLWNFSILQTPLLNAIGIMHGRLQISRASSYGLPFASSICRSASASEIGFQSCHCAHTQIESAVAAGAPAKLRCSCP